MSQRGTRDPPGLFVRLGGWLYAEHRRPSGGRGRPGTPADARSSRGDRRAHRGRAFLPRRRHRPQDPPGAGEPAARRGPAGAVETPPPGRSRGASPRQRGSRDREFLEGLRSSTSGATQQTVAAENDVRPGDGLHEAGRGPELLSAELARQLRAADPGRRCAHASGRIEGGHPLVPGGTPAQAPRTRDCISGLAGS